MRFYYFPGEQLSPEWHKLGLGVATASNLYRFKSKNVKGDKLLKAATDYEKELMFEKTFGRSFEKFVSGAMKDGNEFEDFLRDQYAKVTGYKVSRVGAWYNSFFRASPDGDVTVGSYKNPTGSLEIKVLKDTNFTEVISTGKPYKGSGADHWKQIQGQLFASKRSWCDYVAGNLSTRKFKIIRVYPDKEYFKELEALLREPILAEKFEKTKVYDFVDELPDFAPGAVNASNDALEDF